MKLELSIAADVALVVSGAHPIRAASPAPSRAVTAFTPTRDTGSCAPTRAHATPSRMRCLARSRTVGGTSSSVVLASHVERRPVGPAGSVGWPALSVATVISSLRGFSIRHLVMTIPLPLLISPIDFLMCLIQILNGYG